mgnify:CR=1 FL=1
MKKILTVTVLGLLMGGVVSSQAAVTIRVLPSFGPTQTSPQFAAYAADAVAKIKDGTLPTLMLVAPENLMTRSDGIGTVWWWVDVTVGTGETISMEDISGLFTSSDSGNVLGKVVSLEGTAYSATAPGVRADGTEVTSGPSSQAVKRVIVGIGSKSFPVNSTQDEQQVRDYLNKFPGWRTTAMVTAKGASASFALSKSPPSLVATKVGGKFMVRAENNGDPAEYGLQKSSVLTGSWNSAGTIRAGQTVDFGPATDTALFVRYVPN